MRMTVIVCDGCGKQTEHTYSSDWFDVEQHHKGRMISDHYHLCSVKCVNVWAQRLATEAENADE